MINQLHQCWLTNVGLAGLVKTAKAKFANLTFTIFSGADCPLSSVLLLSFLW